MEATVAQPLPESPDSDDESLAGTQPQFRMDRSGLADDVDLFPPTVEQRRQRVVLLIEQIAPLVASLSAELCKEDHGRFMTTAARVEEAAIIIEANLTELEAGLATGEMPARPGSLLRLMALFWERAARLVQAYASLSRQRERQLETINRLRRQLADLRERPQRIHAEAVEHVKRLILYEDSRVKDLVRLLGDTSEALVTEDRKSRHSDRAAALRRAIESLKEQMPRLEAEAADRALLRIQESDNGKKTG
jgi:hypothetical protein